MRVQLKRAHLHKGSDAWGFSCLGFCYTGIQLQWNPHKNNGAHTKAKLGQWPMRNRKIPETMNKSQYGKYLVNIMLGREIKF